MKRRQFITLLCGAAAPWPLAARAQQSERMRRVGVLMALAESDDTKARIAKFRQELDKLGWSEKHNLRLDVRFAAGREDQFQVLAKELVDLQPDVILAQSPPTVSALQRESRLIPIVFVSVSDPIGSGFVANLARPGGNLTGLLQFEAGITGKWLAMLKEIAPRLARAALLANPKTTANNYFLEAAEVAAASLAIELVPFPVETAADIQRVIESVGRTPNSCRQIPRR
jgi:putative ABC transport system substrate-binding protein